MLLFKCNLKSKHKQHLGFKQYKLHGTASCLRIDLEKIIKQGSFKGSCSSIPNITYKMHIGMHQCS